MPYQNQHACRVKDPSLFKKGTFRTFHTKTKGLSFISAKLKTNDKSEVQSFRYDKNIWSEKRATLDCSSRKGRFDAAVKKLNIFKLKKQAIDYDIRNEKIIDLVDDALNLKLVWNVLKLIDTYENWKKEDVQEYYSKIINILKKNSYPYLVSKDTMSLDERELLK